MANDDVFILGGYQTDFARNWKREGNDFSSAIVEVVNGALEATGVPAEDLQVGHLGNFAAELYTMQGHLGAFMLEASPALYGMPTGRHEAACASGSIATLAALADVRAGNYDVAIVVGVEQMKTVDSTTGGDYLGTAAWYEREAKGVNFPFPALFGRLGDEYETRYGLNDQYLRRISEINFDNAKKNPLAQTRDWKHDPDKMNAQLAGRIKIRDASQVTDGAAAVVIASPSYAAEYAKARGLDVEAMPRFLGWGHRTAPILFDEKVRESAGAEYVLPHTRQAIVDAFGRAGIGDVFELDAIETHDCFTTSEYMAIDHFGITPPGQSWQALEDEVVDLHGKLPMNPSGGLIGAGHPVGGTGVRQVLDAYRQVAGTAGGYQVEGASKVATLNLGGSATTSVCFVIGNS